ncbi:unnamed protein product [Closterium sp. Naga37s-1]|nr:unnamed protein product [Closterium sp. Naga37s-1]
MSYRFSVPVLNQCPGGGSPQTSPLGLRLVIISFSEVQRTSYFRSRAGRSICKPTSGAFLTNSANWGA